MVVCCHVMVMRMVMMWLVMMVRMSRVAVVDGVTVRRVPSNSSTQRGRPIIVVMQVNQGWFRDCWTPYRSWCVAATSCETIKIVV